MASSPIVVATIDKDPEDKTIRGLDWGAFLTQLGGGLALTTSTWSAPSDLTLTNQGMTGASTISAVLIAGGYIGNDYLVTNHVMLTDNKQEYDRSLLIRVLGL